MGDNGSVPTPVRESEHQIAKSTAYQGPVSSQDQQFSGHAAVRSKAPAQSLAPNLDRTPSSAFPNDSDSSSFNMGHVVHSLPPQNIPPTFATSSHQHHAQHQHRSGTQPQRFSGMPPASNMYNRSGPHALHFQTQQNVMGQPFYMMPQAPVAPYYGHQQMPVSQGLPPQFPPGQSRSGAAYYPGSYMMGQQSSPGYYYPSQIASFQPSDHHMTGVTHAGHHVRTGNEHSSNHSSPAHTITGDGVVDNAVRASTVRGPPRKPRQSGHAIWIGNLPPQTDLMSLVRHVCSETPGLESLFLISKSNCAFANFHDEKTCIAAQQQLHDSKFQSVRLVSRLRKSTVEGSAGQTAPTGPASTTPAVQAPPEAKGQSELADKNTYSSTYAEVEQQNDHANHEQIPTQTLDRVFQRDRFFVLKSLTVEDLELSVQNGVWATQSHNEGILNRAFETASNVYLVFSANKSGEYFGYARMTSPIDNDPAAAIKFAPKVQGTSETDLPKSIVTEATDNCPRGRIIDDSSRGTIFWEIDRDDDDETANYAPSDTSGSIHDPAEADEESKAWGKPFKLEWQSTTRLPFYRTRGLRNVWNSNRDVKIARDGTELETSVGKKLIGLFNRGQTPVPHMDMTYQMAMMPHAGYGVPPHMSPSYR